jgi:hypothetical protein
MKKLILSMCCLLFAINGAALAKEVMINPITPDIRDMWKTPWPPE